MFTVALIGPDGAGKTTLAHRLEERLPFPTTYVYMGDNPESATHQSMLTRALWAVRRRRGKHATPGPPPLPSVTGSTPVRRENVGAAAAGAARLVLAVIEEWYRQAVAWRLLRRGHVVIFDRHYFADYYAHHVVGEGRGFAARLHGVVLHRLYPKPDLTVLLDAPAEVLLRRKAEGTLAALDHRRREYLNVVPRGPQFLVVDAAGPLEQVEESVLDAVIRFARDRG